MIGIEVSFLLSWISSSNTILITESTGRAQREIFLNVKSYVTNYSTVLYSNLYSVQRTSDSHIADTCHKDDPAIVSSVTLQQNAVLFSISAFQQTMQVTENTHWNGRAPAWGMPPKAKPQAEIFFAYFYHIYN